MGSFSMVPRPQSEPIHNSRCSERLILDVLRTNRSPSSGQFRGDSLCVEQNQPTDRQICPSPSVKMGRRYGIPNIAPLIHHTTANIIHTDSLKYIYPTSIFWCAVILSTLRDPRTAANIFSVACRFSSTYG